MVSNGPKSAGNAAVKWHKVTLLPSCWLHRKNYLPLVSDGYHAWGKDEWDVNFFPRSDVVMITHLCSSSSLPYALYSEKQDLEQDLGLFQLESIFSFMLLHMKKKRFSQQTSLFSLKIYDNMRCIVSSILICLGDKFLFSSLKITIFGKSICRNKQHVGCQSWISLIKNCWDERTQCRVLPCRETSGEQ